MADQSTFEIEETMGLMLRELVQILISEEITRIVAEAVESGECISALAHARQIGGAYPNSGLSHRDIADEIMMAAATAGVAVEIGQSRALKTH